ncbi:hypothetical protein I547_0781 [Mycobacterium kansasii 824]|nr:hypothetical protein I547_0781 [Mycobacterium kansasii 824]
MAGAAHRAGRDRGLAAGRDAARSPGRAAGSGFLAALGGSERATAGAPPAAPPRQHPPDNPGHTLEILLAYTVPLLIMIVVAAAVMARRRWRAAPPARVAADDVEFPGPAEGAELLARAAEVGLAEMTDLDREPREAIIACYAAMERELANVPGAVPQDFDTPTEVLARAVAHGVLRPDNAGQLVNLFAEARFSPHVMNEGHRELAVRVLRLVLDELAPRIQRAGL